MFWGEKLWSVNHLSAANTSVACCDGMLVRGRARHHRGDACGQVPGHHFEVWRLRGWRQERAGREVNLLLRDTAHGLPCCLAGEKG